MINLSSRHLTMMAAVAVLLGLAVFFRYDIKPNVLGTGYYYLDRWTGDVTFH